jgi:mannose-1-phosphate guanylyltransferase
LHEETFMQYIEFSSEFVTSDPESIILLGVVPQQPQGEYGWIVTSERIANDNGKRVYNISRFVEKPDLFTAYQLYLADGMWNTMVIVTKAKTLLTSFKMLTPTVYDAFWEIRDFLGSSLEARVVEEVYSKLSPTNFSYSILEKNPIGLRAVRMQGVYWNDWGDAARIQSDIRCFCAAKEVSRIPLPFLEIDQSPVPA